MTDALLALQVRPARAEDARDVIALLESEKLEAAFDPAEFVVAHEGARVVACARLKPLPGGVHEIASVAVSRELRGQRVGERVVREVLARATGAVYALALAPGFFETLGFERLPDTPSVLAEKAEGTCASSGFVPMRWTPSPEAAVADIRRYYADIALRGTQKPQEFAGDACCTSSCCARDYSPDELAALPEGAELGLGTGAPVREAKPQPGETVVDLGSGGGVDTFLSAAAVGPSGRAIGIDFTPEMVARARANAEKAGHGNVQFIESPIEKLPLPDASADVVTSNCVINLSLDKPAVLREAHRILKAGGRFVVSDTLRMPWSVKSDQPSCECTTGALSPGEWTRMLADAGFADAHVRVTDAGEGRSVGRGIITARKLVS